MRGSIGKPEVTSKHLRVPFHFGDLPILLVRLILEGLVSDYPDQYHYWSQLVLEDLFKMVHYFNFYSKNYCSSQYGKKLTNDASVEYNIFVFRRSDLESQKTKL